MKELCEKLAEQYAEDKSKAYYIDQNGDQKWYMTERGRYSKEDFLAGYQAGCTATQTQLAVGDEVISELLAKPQWISVKERLPEDGVGWCTVYGCILSRWSVQPGFYDRESKEWVSRFINGYMDDEGYAPFESVTHWMPLPELPKEEK